MGIRGTAIRRWKLARIALEGEAVLKRLGVKTEVLKTPDADGVVGDRGTINVASPLGGSQQPNLHRWITHFRLGKTG